MARTKKITSAPVSEVDETPAPVAVPEPEKPVYVKNCGTYKVEVVWLGELFVFAPGETKKVPVGFEIAGDVPLKFR